MAKDKPAAITPATDSAMPESSMEDIIASISRIIAEDSRTSNPALSSPGGKRGILELTDAIEDDGSVRKLAGKPRAPEAAAGPPGPTALTALDAPPAAQAAPRGAADDARDNLVSAATAEAAVAAFARLGTAASEQHVTPGPALGAGGRTLEDIVRDVLRPLLQAWLDEHLPGIVERLIHDEIQRLVRQARPR